MAAKLTMGQYMVGLTVDELDCLSDLVVGKNRIEDWQDDLVAGLRRKLCDAFNAAMEQA